MRVLYQLNKGDIQTRTELGHTELGTVLSRAAKTFRLATYMKKTLHPRLAFTLIETLIVVGIVGLLAAIAIPSILRARARSQTNACINNLRQIHDAKQQWAIDQHKPADAVPLKSDISHYLGRSGNIERICCPADPTELFDNSYNINQVTNPPTCKLNETGIVIGHVLK